MCHRSPGLWSQPWYSTLDDTRRKSLNEMVDAAEAYLATPGAVAQMAALVAALLLIIEAEAS